MTNGFTASVAVIDDPVVTRLLEPLVADGLAVLEADRVTLTPLGRLFARNVAACFDAYAGDVHRHASAV